MNPPLHDARILVFDPFRGGHHPEYLSALVRTWHQASTPGHLTVACPSATFADARLDTVTGRGSRVEHLELPDLQPWPVVGRFAADRRHARSLEWAIDQVRPTDAVAMYLDRLLFPIASRVRLPAGTRLHGIYFRPSVHYAQLHSSRLTFDECVRARARHTLLLAALRNPSMSTVFSLDPTFVEWFGTRERPAVVACPDVVTMAVDPAQAVERRRRWNVPVGRRTALMFGVLARRKGVGSLCEALRRLQPRDQERLAVVFCGKPVPAERAEIEADLASVSTSTSVVVVVDEEEVHFTQVQSAFEASDLAVIPYLRHIGSSAVLLRAATAQRPVVASDFGLVGHYVATSGLGRAVDTREPSALAAALHEWLQDGGVGFDPARARALANSHGADAMASTILDRLVDVGRPRALERRAA